MTSGKKVQAEPASKNKPAFALIPDKKLLHIYQSMLLCELLRSESRNARNGAGARLNGPVQGHEAILAALAVDLRKNDFLSIPPCDSAAGFLKGQSLRSLPPPSSTRPTNPRAMLNFFAKNVVPPAKDAATQIQLATGLALGRKHVVPGSTVAVFCADPELSTACWSEVLTMANQGRLPIIFLVLETPRGRGKLDRMAQSARVHGVPLIVADAMDAVALYRVIYESLSRARRGGGPTLVACQLGLGHSRKNSNDALARMEAYLRHRGLRLPKVAAEFYQPLPTQPRIAARRKNNRGKKLDAH